MLAVLVLTSFSILNPSLWSQTTGFTQEAADNQAKTYARIHSANTSALLPFIGNTRISVLATAGAQFAVASSKDSDFSLPSGTTTHATLEHVLATNYYVGARVPGLSMDVYAGYARGTLRINPSFFSRTLESLLGFSLQASIDYSNSYVGFRKNILKGLSLVPLLLKWHGLVLHSGFINSTFDVDHVLSANNENVIRYKLNSKLFAIPIEAVSGFQLSILGLLPVRVNAALGTLLSSGSTSFESNILGESLSSKSNIPVLFPYLKLGAEIPLLPFVRFGYSIVRGGNGHRANSVSIRADI